MLAAAVRYRQCPPLHTLHYTEPGSDTVLPAARASVMFYSLLYTRLLERSEARRIIMRRSSTRGGFHGEPSSPESQPGVRKCWRHILPASDRRRAARRGQG